MQVFGNLAKLPNEILIRNLKQSDKGDATNAFFCFPYKNSSSLLENSSSLMCGGHYYCLCDVDNIIILLLRCNFKLNSSSKFINRKINLPTTALCVFCSEQCQKNADGLLWTVKHVPNSTAMRNTRI